MNRYRPMRESETVALALFDHPEGMVHNDPKEEIADEYSISYVEHSGFEVQVGRKRWQFQQGDVFLTFPGLAYRCHHSESIPTDRTSHTDNATSCSAPEASLELRFS